MGRERKSPLEVSKHWMQLQKDPPGFTVDSIKDKGRGIRTLQKRVKGDFLLHYAGELISEEEGEQRENDDSSGFRYFFR
ncbi:hypothetical protein ScPMuIL_003568 [Solemya velum]